MNTTPFMRGITVAVLAASASVTGAAGVQSAGAATDASATSVASSLSSVASASTRYVAVVSSGGRQRLSVVDRRTGRVVRTVGTAAVGQSIVDVDLAADGSVYAVVRTGRSAYGYTLMRYANGRATRVAPYVTSVVASPDARLLAVTVVSPDGDGDGRGLEALRLLTPSGRLVRTLDTTRFLVDPFGEPQYETGGLLVQGWVNAGSLVVSTGCCEDADVHLVRTDVARSRNTWPTFDGWGDAKALGVKGSSVLVARPFDLDDGTGPAGIEVGWLSAGSPQVRIVQVIRGRNLSVDASAAALVRRYGATPLAVSTSTFPYRGTGSVVLAGV